MRSPGFLLRIESLATRPQWLFDLCVSSHRDRPLAQRILYLEYSQGSGKVYLYWVRWRLASFEVSSRQRSAAA